MKFGENLFTISTLSFYYALLLTYKLYANLFTPTMRSNWTIIIHSRVEHRMNGWSVVQGFLRKLWERTKTVEEVSSTSIFWAPFAAQRNTFISNKAQYIDVCLFCVFVDFKSITFRILSRNIHFEMLCWEVFFHFIAWKNEVQQTIFFRNSCKILIFWNYSPFYNFLIILNFGIV